MKSGGNNPLKGDIEVDEFYVCAQGRAKQVVAMKRSNG